MSEKWLPLPGFEDYLISDQGRVYSLKHERYVTGSANGRGVYHVYITGAGMQKIGHLVLRTFVGPRPAGLEACHYNDIQSDNRLSNLRWDTRSANEQDKLRNGGQKTCCINGHPYTPENTGIDRHRGGRRCRQCRRAAMQRYFANKERKQQIQ